MSISPIFASQGRIVLPSYTSNQVQQASRPGELRMACALDVHAMIQNDSKGERVETRFFEDKVSLDYSQNRSRVSEGPKISLCSAYVLICTLNDASACSMFVRGRRACGGPAVLWIILIHNELNAVWTLLLLMDLNSVPLKGRDAD